jgi:isopentenyl-diphosphate delta-isomerase
VEDDTALTARRKADHLRINLEEDVRAKGISSGFEAYRFEHQALPELDLAAVATDSVLFGKKLAAPLLISSMTGGVEQAQTINRRLAAVAQRIGIAMGLGSQRIAIERPEAAALFQIRDIAPDILLFGNLGAVQLNYGYGVEQCRRAIEMVGADGLFLHLNPLQEAVQNEGNVDFSGLLARIEAVCRGLTVPVIVKEVGWGISGAVAQQLFDAGVAAIDVAGAGGTSWSEVEKHRAASPLRARVAGAFAGWGIGTADSLVAVRRVAPDLPVFASGGIRNGIDVAKAVALGASLAGLASPVLKAAVRSEEAALEELEATIQELRISMFCVGAGSLAELRGTAHLARSL